VLHPQHFNNSTQPPLTLHGIWIDGTPHNLRTTDHGSWGRGVISFAPQKGPRCSRFLPSNLYLHPK